MWVILDEADESRERDSATRSAPTAEADQPELAADPSSDVEPVPSLSQKARLPEALIQVAPSQVGLPQIDEALQLEAGPGLQRRRFISWRALAQSLLVVFLAALLPAQYLFHNQATLLQSSQWRPVYERFCQLTGCVLPPLTDISAIRSERLQITNHPMNNEYLQVDLQLINSASFAQPFPALELTFTDHRGNVTAADRLSPTEYLPASGLPIDRQLAANSVHTLELTLLNPGENVVNYRLGLAPANPAASGRLSWPALAGGVE